MKRFFLGLVVILVVLIAAGVASAASGGPVQGIGQSADASQAAFSASAATQQQPTNTVDPVSVLSPGSNGAVAQSNGVDSASSSTNHNSADQNASQFLAGLACGCAADLGYQAIGQTGAAEQAGAAISGAQQSGADNAVSTDAPASGPTVGQSNSAGSSADASNGNAATQTASQGPSAGAGQVVGQVGEFEADCGRWFAGDADGSAEQRGLRSCAESWQRRFDEPVEPGQLGCHGKQRQLAGSVGRPDRGRRCVRLHRQRHDSGCRSVGLL